MKFKPDTFITVPSKYRLMEVDGIAQSIFLWLCSHTDKAGYCFPSIRRLGELSKVSKNTVKNRLKKLETAGLIIKTNRQDAGVRRSNLYQIIVDSWSPNLDERGRATNASYRAVADWIRDHELPTN